MVPGVVLAPNMETGESLLNSPRAVPAAAVGVSSTPGAATLVLPLLDPALSGPLERPSHAIRTKIPSWLAENPENLW